MRAKHELLLALTYGFVVCLTIVLFVESWLSLAISSFFLAVVIAPIVEESAKNIPTLLRREHIISWAVVVALGFALGEYLFKNIIEYIDTKTWCVSFAPFLHIGFVLPCCLLYAGTKSRRWGMIGLIIAMLLHGITNLVIIQYGG